MSITPVNSLPGNGVTTGAVQITGTALRVSARVTSGGPVSLALIRMNSSGEWFRVTDENGIQLELELPGVGEHGNTDWSFTLPAEAASEWYNLLLDGGSTFSGLAEILSCSAPAAAGGTVPQGRTITAGSGLTFGGSSSADLSADRTVAIDSTMATLSATALTLKASVDLLGTAGDGAVDLSMTTGTFKPPTGIFTFQGKKAATASANAITDPGNAGAVPVTTDGVCAMTSAGAETRTLAIPTYRGQRLALICDTYLLGNIVITSAQSINQANNTVMTFGAAADMIELTAMTVGGALRWRITANDGVALS